MCVNCDLDKLNSLRTIKPLLFLIHHVFNTLSGRKKLMFWEISISVHFMLFFRNDKKFDFWP